MKYLLTACLILGVTGYCSAQTQQESLAELVKHSKGNKKEVIRLSDDELPAVRTEQKPSDLELGSSAPVTAPPVKATAPSDPAPTSPTISNDRPTGPSSKLSEVEELQQKLAGYRQQEETWSRSAAEYENKLANKTSEFRRNTYREALDNDRKNVGYYRQKIAETEEQLAKAEQESTNRDKAASPGQP
jgi:hypothetical protein